MIGLDEGKDTFVTTGLEDAFEVAWASMAKGEPVTYKGSRTVEDLIKFVKENGKYQASVAEKKEEETPVAPAATESTSSEAAKESGPVRVSIDACG